MSSIAQHGEITYSPVVLIFAGSLISYNKTNLSNLAQHCEMNEQDVSKHCEMRLVDQNSINMIECKGLS